MWRGLAWLIAGAAFVAAVNLGRDPPDPSRTPTAAAGRVLVYAAAARDKRLVELAPRSSPDELPREMAAFASTPEELQGARRLLQVSAQAGDRHPLEPEMLAVMMVLPVPHGLVKTGSVAVIPSWSFQASFERAQPWRASAVIDGAVLVDSLRPELAELAASYGMGLTTIPSPTFKPTGDIGYPVLYATYFLDPFWSDAQSAAAVVRSYFRADSRGEIHSDGLLLYATADAHAEVRGLLSDPAVIRLSHALRLGSLADRRSARRAAFWDDDARIVRFAAHDQANRDIDAAEWEDFPVAMLQTWPHRDTNLHDVEMEVPVDVVLSELPPAEAAQELARLARTTVDGDRLASVLGPVLEANAEEKTVLRKAAMDAILERLPRRALATRREDSRLALISEREALMAALVDRLRDELRHGDAGRATELAADAAALCCHGFLEPGSPARSRVLELTSQLVLDPERRAAIEKNKDALVETLRELLRSSDPEVRRAACIQLLVVSPGQFQRHPLAGDPFCDDLVKEIGTDELVWGISESLRTRD